MKIVKTAQEPYLSAFDKENAVKCSQWADISSESVHSKQLNESEHKRTDVNCHLHVSNRTSNQPYTHRENCIKCR